MSFTPEHVEVLEKHREYWDTLRTAGFMRNLDAPVFAALYKVHEQALGPGYYNNWCPSCVADMVRILYTNYDAWRSKSDGAPVGNSARGKRNKRR